MAYRPGEQLAVKITGTVYVFDAQGQAQFILKEGMTNGSRTQRSQVAANR